MEEVCIQLIILENVGKLVDNLTLAMAHGLGEKKPLISNLWNDA